MKRFFAALTAIILFTSFWPQNSVKTLSPKTQQIPRITVSSSVHGSTSLASYKSVASGIFTNFKKQSASMFLYGPDFLKTASQAPISNAKNSYIKSKALKITKGCYSKKAKIYAVCKWTANNFYYDSDFAAGRKSSVYTKPYDVLIHRYTICQGFAETCRALLQAVNVPCIDVTSITYKNASHAFNCAYDGKNWLFFDATWCTGNQYKYGKKVRGKTSFSKWCGFSFSRANSDTYHIISDMEYTIKSGVLTNFPSYSKLKSFKIPSGVKAIGNNAFFGRTRLEQIILPGSISRLEENAFALCKNLKAAYFYGNAPVLGTNAFARCAQSFKIYYTNQSKGFSQPWKGFQTSLFTRVTGIKLSIGALNLNKGATYKLNASVDPSNAVIKNVEWKSSNASTVTVSAYGTITAKAKGTAYITVTSVDGNKTTNCKVIVN